MTKQKLELTWIGKDKRPRLEPRIVLEDPEKSYHAAFKNPPRLLVEGQGVREDIFDNRLIFGDNLLALKAFEQEFTGQVKCVFIDPPYNTGSAFTHYYAGRSLVQAGRFHLCAIGNALAAAWVFQRTGFYLCHHLKPVCRAIAGAFR